MINDGINDVPKNTIAVFSPDSYENFDFKKISQIVTKPSNKRDWFTSNFYNCLPLIIGNQYGFIVTLNHDFNVIWNGGNEPEDLNITWITPDASNLNHMTSVSHFGNGIISVTLKAFFKTPPGVNLITINPPNYIIKNATVLTGVIESDNLRMPFTFNLRVHEPNIITSFPAGTPISGFIPIPRMFADQFVLKDAREIFKNEIVQEEVETSFTARKRRHKQNIEGLGPDRDYFRGQDILGNKFIEHQNANGKLKKTTTS